MYAWLDSSDWMHFNEFRASMLPAEVTYDRMLAGACAGAGARVCVWGGGRVQLGGCDYVVGRGELLEMHTN